MANKEFKFIKLTKNRIAIYYKGRYLGTIKGNDLLKFLENKILDIEEFEEEH